MMSLTPRQADLLAYLRAEAARGFAPSYREMAAAIGVSRACGAHRLVDGLADRGFVRRAPQRFRNVELTAPVSVQPVFINGARYRFIAVAALAS